VETYPDVRHHHTPKAPPAAIKAAKPTNVFQDLKLIFMTARPSPAAVYDASNISAAEGKSFDCRSKFNGSRFDVNSRKTIQSLTLNFEPGTLSGFQ
jgi:hypothetical protein